MKDQVDDFGRLAASWDFWAGSATLAFVFASQLLEYMRLVPFLVAAAICLAIAVCQRGASVPRVARIHLTSSLPAPAAGQLVRDTPPPAPSAAAAERLRVLRGAARVYTDVFRSPDSSPPEHFEGRNPCWGDGKAQHCLPAFYLLGVYQAGVLDLYSRLEAHPSVAKLARSSRVAHSFYSQVHPTWSEYLRALAPAVGEASAGRLIGEASPVTFHFVWVHQEKFNTAYVEAMGGFWRECNGRSAAAKLALPHRECMRRRMPEARAAEAAVARRAGLRLQPPTLMRAVYGSFEPRLVLLLRRPAERMHAAFYNYVHYRRRYAELGSDSAGELAWANESVSAFERCTARFGAEDCALRFESLTRENEETFYHADQLIKGLYALFLPHWRREFAHLLPLRSEEYFASPRAVLGRVLPFLGLPLPASEREWGPLLDGPRVLHGTRPGGGKPPLPAAVAQLLHRFYLPFQLALVEQLRAHCDAAELVEWRSWAMGTAVRAAGVDRARGAEPSDVELL